MSCSLVRVVDAALEPITLDEARAFLRISDADRSQDSEIIEAIGQARELAELYSGRSFLQQDWKLTRDGFGERIDLWHPPVQSVTSVKFIDTGGVQQTLDPSVYRFIPGPPAFIEPQWGMIWPVLRGVSSQVEIVYRAGYSADPAALPRVVKRAIRQLVAYLFEERGETVALQTGIVPLPVRRILDPVKVPVYA